MARWLYVRAVVDGKEAYDANPGAIGFEHTFVEATDSDDAYDKGHYALGDPALGEAGDFANDYVIELP